MKIINAVWFSEGGSNRIIGVVFGVDEITGEYKAYIGTGIGFDEGTDADLIATHGSKFPIKAAKVLFE